MLKISKFIFVIIIFIAIIINVVIPICYGNSAEPPSILIIVANAPDDLIISIGSNNTYTKANKTDKILESYYTFYSLDLKIANDYTIKIHRGNSTFEVLLKQPLKSYNNIFTLDLNNKTLIPGKLSTRSIFLVFLRMTLTLLIEAIIFWLFGFRYKKSWITFLTINLITQGALNIWLNGFTPLASYIIITLIFAEILIFIVESIAFLLLIKEHYRIRVFLYVSIANFFSLFAGGYIITFLPI